MTILSLRASKPCLLVLLVLSLCFSVSVYAQKEKKGFKKGGVVKLNDSLTVYSQSDRFDFPNVNKIKSYRNETRLEKIQNLDNAGQEAQMYEELKVYVRNFGIENFSKNVAMIWRLAKLSETHGPPGESLLLYKLVLKHHQQGLDIHDIYKRSHRGLGDVREFRERRSHRGVARVETCQALAEQLDIEDHPLLGQEYDAAWRLAVAARLKSPAPPVHHDYRARVRSSSNATSRGKACAGWSAQGRPSSAAAH